MIEDVRCFVDGEEIPFRLIEREEPISRRWWQIWRPRVVGHERRQYVELVNPLRKGATISIGYVVRDSQGPKSVIVGSSMRP